MINNLSNSYKANFCGVNTKNIPSQIGKNPLWKKGINKINKLSNELGQDILIKSSDSTKIHGDCFLEASSIKPVNTPWGGNAWDTTISQAKYRTDKENDKALYKFFNTIEECLKSYTLK